MTDRLTEPPELDAAEATLEDLETVQTRRHDAYPAYRPSGIEWLGDVPEHWDVKRLKFGLSLNEGGIWGEEADSEGTIILRSTEQTVGGGWNIQDPACRVLSRQDKRRYTLELNDLVITKSSGSQLHIGKTSYVNAEVVALKPCFSNFMQRLRTNSHLNSRFAYFVLNCPTGRQQLVYQSKTTTGLANLNGAILGDVQIAFPPLEEQRKIARFLDERTARIDGLISSKRELLALSTEKRQAVITHAVTKGLDPAAKLKPSGVKWLGDVPEHWDVTPLYARYDSVLGKMLDENRMTGDALIPYLRNVDVQWDYVNTEDLPEMDIDSSEYERFTVRQGDLLICEGGEVGRSAIWSGELSICGFQKAIHRVRSRSARDMPRFLLYVLKCAAACGAFIAGSNPNTIPHLTGEKLGRHRFPMPPPEEQRKIARFLDEETARIDELEAAVREAISSLEAYRNSLISAAVTGKIDVRGDAG